MNTNLKSPDRTKNYPYYVLEEVDEESGTIPISVYWTPKVMHKNIMQIIVKMEDADEADPILLNHAQQVVASLNSTVSLEHRSISLSDQVARLKAIVLQYEQGVKCLLEDQREDALIMFLAAKHEVQPAKQPA